MNNVTEFYQFILGSLFFTSLNGRCQSFTDIRTQYKSLTKQSINFCIFIQMGTVNVPVEMKCLLA